MKRNDAPYQLVVNELALEFLRRSTEELIAQPDYGDIVRQIDGNDVSVAFWHFHLEEDVDHIVFILHRRLIIPFIYRKFISGVVFGRTREPRLMTDEEVGNYD